MVPAIGAGADLNAKLARGLRETSVRPTRTPWSASSSTSSRRTSSSALAPLSKEFAARMASLVKGQRRSKPRTILSQNELRPAPSSRSSFAQPSSIAVLGTEISSVRMLAAGPNLFPRCALMMLSCCFLLARRNKNADPASSLSRRPH